jgi:hypothetical protein
MKPTFVLHFEVQVSKVRELETLHLATPFIFMEECHVNCYKDQRAMIDRRMETRRVLLYRMDHYSTNRSKIYQYIHTTIPSSPKGIINKTRDIHYLRQEKQVQELVLVQRRTIKIK